MNKQQRQPLDLGQNNKGNLPEISTPVKLVGWIIAGSCAVAVVFIILMLVAALGV